MGRPATVKTRVTGIPENKARLAGVARDVDRMRETHRAMAQMVLPDAAANVPNTTGRGTGRLAGSLIANGNAKKGWLRSRMPYAFLIERDYGFVTAAVASNNDALRARYEQGLDEIIAAHP